LGVIAGAPAAADIFEGVDLTWNRVPGGAELGELLRAVHQRYDPSDPAASLADLLSARAALSRLMNTAAGRTHAVLLRHKARELDEVVRGCAGLWLEAVAAQHTLSPGDSLLVDVTAINRSSEPIRLERIRSETPGLAIEVDTLLAGNVPLTLPLRSVVPATLDWRASQPYWLLEPVSGGLHRVADPSLIGTPENEPALRVTLTVSVLRQSIDYTVPVLYRWVDRVRGELYRPPAIAPEVTLALDEPVYLFADASPRPVRLRLESRQAVHGSARLLLPAGWSSDPIAHDVSLEPGQVREVVFRVTPGVEGSPIRAEFSDAQRTWSRGVTVIDHPHIPIQTVFPDASAHVLRLDLARAGDTIGYIMGPGDDVPAALAQAGYRVTLLEDDELASGDLSAYDALVVGVRAYNSRDALKRSARRLLDYVENGGTLVVQYNTADPTLHEAFAPYPLKLGRDRVAEENAAVELIDRESPLLNTPNRITRSDFDGWVQERGLYFASEWGPEY
ncbi:MAG: LmbE family protein, partial [bacterium]